MLLLHEFEMSGLNAYWLRSPTDVLYRPGSLPGKGEGSAEAALTGSVWVSNKSLNYAITQGIKTLEPEMVKGIANNENTGALIIAQVYTCNITDPNVGVPFRSFHAAWVDSFGKNDNKHQLATVFDNRPRIAERRPRYTNTFFMFWATKDRL